MDFVDFAFMVVDFAKQAVDFVTVTGFRGFREFRFLSRPHYIDKTTMGSVE